MNRVFLAIVIVLLIVGCFFVVLPAASGAPGQALNAIGQHSQLQNALSPR